jgi:hypothetical protein
MAEDTHQLARQVPLLEHITDLFVVETELAHETPGFADGAHHAVFDTVVHHLNIVTCTAPSDDTHTRLAFLIFGCDLLEKWEDLFQTRFIASRTHGWASSRRLVATTDTASNVANTCVIAFVLPSLGVCEVFVAAVEDDVSLGQLGHETLQHLVTDASVR